MTPIRLKVEANGRVLLPAEFRKKLGVAPGDELVADIDEKGVHLWTQTMALRALQQWARENVPPGVSLVDELFAMRRADTEKFEAKYPDKLKGRGRARR